MSQSDVVWQRVFSINACSRVKQDGKIYSWAWVKPPSRSQICLVMGSWESICWLTSGALALWRKALVSPPLHAHIHKGLCGLPGSSMLLSTWDFSQSGGGRLDEHSHHVLWLPHSSVLVPAVSSISNQVCTHVYVWLRWQAYVRSCGSIADKRAKHCLVLLRAKLSYRESCDHITLLHGEILTETEREREEKTSKMSIDEGASCWVLRNNAH